MKPPPGYERKLAKIAAREDRHLVPREEWTERDWRVQRQQDKERRDRKATLLASLDRLDRPVVIPDALPVAGFSLFDRTADEERQRRIAANRILEKHGARPRTRW